MSSRQTSSNNVLYMKVRLSRRESRKLAAFASLASIVLLVTLANTSLMAKSGKASSSQGGRMIASVENFMDQGQKNHWVRDYIQSRANLAASNPNRGTASLGIAPSVIDDLRFGLLEGKYALRVKSGRLAEIEFIETTEDRPKYIADKTAFLEKYKELFKVDFDKAVKSNSQANGDLQEEFFQLVSRDSAVAADAKFVSDSSGRVLAVQIQPH